MRRKTAFPLLICLCVAVSAAAQDTRVSLREALSLVTREKNTRFVFERTVVEGVTVRYDWSQVKSRQVETVLRELLEPVQLDYVPLGSNHFIIRNKKTGDVGGDDSTAPGPQAAAERDTLPVTAVKAGELSGTVVEKQSGNPVEAATIQVQPYGLYAVTGRNGKFTVKNVPLGKVRVVVSSLGMVGEEQELQVTGTASLPLVFRLTANALSLKEIQVVAKESKNGVTASSISRVAIEHMQATSLADVMQLLPGGVANNPDLSGVNQVAIRQVNTDPVGSLGTAVMINGAPVSNNANMQVSNTATAGANASFSTSSGGGVDLRQVSADNIESIEVIRGIPSVEYGDLTSGAILVKTKAGKEPLHIKARINPRITQLWAGKGFDLGKNAGSLFADVDYTRSFDDQRFEYRGYHRMTANVLYSRQFGKSLHTTTGFSYAMNLDEQQQDPDDKRYQLVREAQDYSYRFTSNGRWNLQKKWAKVINYNLAVNYAVQEGFQQQLLSGYIYPLSYAMKDTTLNGQFVPSEYLSRLWVEGKPLNVFAKLNNTFFFGSKGFNQRFLVGAEWKTDVNFGAGKTYDLNRPPQMQGGSGSRPRPYKDVPALNQLSFYLEDNIIATVLQRRMSLQAGVRMDNIQPTGLWSSRKGTVVAPRLNWMYELGKNFSIRAGYGITAKAPTLLYLYPQNAYYDMMNYNHYAQDPTERLVVITTRVFNTENDNLRIMTNRKKEAGFDWTFAGRKRLAVTAFHEKTTNGYGFAVAPWSVSLVPLSIYSAASQPAGQPPVLNPDPVRVDTFVADYNVPLNNRINTNRGLEFDLSLGRVDAIRTSFVINGAWIRSASVNSEYYVNKRQVNGADPRRIAVYDKGRGVASERLNSTVRMIHNIPDLRFVVTLAVQTIWSESNRNIGYDSIPVAYINRGTGQMTFLSKNERSGITVADRDLFESYADGYFREERWKPLWLFNLRLTKEIGRNMGFSFFANNVFSHQPLEQSTRYPTEFVRRNPVLFFGTEISVKL